MLCGTAPGSHCATAAPRGEAQESRRCAQQGLARQVIRGVLGFGSLYICAMFQTLMEFGETPGFRAVPGSGALGRGRTIRPRSSSAAALHQASGLLQACCAGLRIRACVRGIRAEAVFVAPRLRVAHALRNWQARRVEGRGC